MSTVKATNFQHPSSAAANITLGSDGSVVLPAGFSGGLGTNVVGVLKTDTFTTTSTSFVDVTGLTVTITPSSATSKILLVGNIQFSITSNSSSFIQLLRDATIIGSGDSALTRTQAFAGTWNRTTDGSSFNVHPNGIPVALLDSPATASAVTYKFQMKASGGTARLNASGSDTNDPLYSRTSSQLVAIEVAA